MISRIVFSFWRCSRTHSSNDAELAWLLFLKSIKSLFSALNLSFISCSSVAVSQVTRASDFQKSTISKHFFLSSDSSWFVIFIVSQLLHDDKPSVPSWMQSITGTKTPLCEFENWSVTLVSCTNSSSTFMMISFGVYVVRNTIAWQLTQLNSKIYAPTCIQSAPNLQY